MGSPRLSIALALAALDPAGEAMVALTDKADSAAKPLVVGASGTSAPITPLRALTSSAASRPISGVTDDG